MKQAVLYKKLKSSAVQCTACQHYCTMKRDEFGKCGVRRNEDGELKLLTYGRPSAVNIDPIEKKPLYHFLPGTAIFSLGTAGCNFTCGFCQNWDLSQTVKGAAQKGEPAVSELPGGDIVTPEDAVAYVKKNGIPSIAYTYNEPTIFIEYAHDIGVLARAEGIRNVFVSNGFMTKEARVLLADMLDAINIDLKSYSDVFYKKNCGARLDPVLENIRELKKAGVWVEVTTLLVPEENDSDEELRAIARFLKGVDQEIPWHISRFHPDYRMADRSATAEKDLLRAYGIGKKEGLQHVYIGNLPSAGYESTVCPSCGAVAVERSGFEVNNKTANGICRKCNYQLKGIWI